ncbi:MAG TPA: hypothetical protein VGD21_05185 [Lysobacter sp.]
MNAILSATIPLPAILDRPSRNGPGRRHRIDDFELSTAAVDRFNDLLTRLGRRTAPLDCDRIATAARELRDGAANDDAPLCIRQRIQRLEAAARMIGEAGWEPADEAGNAAAVVVRYARSSHHVLPPTLPKVGRLDEAIVVDAAWPALAAEVANFLDFCRLREIEAELRGCGANAFTFTRANWEQARRAEAILAVQRRCIREGSYLPALTPRFVVH